MSNLRETLLEIQKEKTLKRLLGNNFSQATDAEKAHYLSVLGNSIENDVDQLLHQYVLNFQNNTPTRKKGKKLRWVYIIGNVVLGLGSAYAVNETEWVYVSILGFLMVVNQLLPFIYEE